MIHCAGNLIVCGLLPGLTSAADCKTGEKVSFDEKGINLHIDKYNVRLLKLTF